MASNKTLSFSPINLPSLIIEPLRYFFGTYGGPSKFVWNADPKIRTVEIDHMSNFYKVALEERPRILVDRGGFQTMKSGVTNGLAEGLPFSQTNGLRNDINYALYSGAMNVTVEARNMGTCELVSDMAYHFILWTRPQICDTQGFNDFGGNLVVSPCQPVEKENTEKFQVQIQVPWNKGEPWSVKNDGITMKNALLNTVPK